MAKTKHGLGNDESTPRDTEGGGSGDTGSSGGGTKSGIFAIRTEVKAGSKGQGGSDTTTGSDDTKSGTSATLLEAEEEANDDDEAPSR